MTSAVDVSDEAVEKMLEESLEHAFEDMNDRIFTEAKLKADELLPAVRNALEQVGAELDADERALIAAARRAKWKPPSPPAPRNPSSAPTPPSTKPPSASPPCSSSARCGVSPPNSISGVSFGGEESREPLADRCGIASRPFPRDDFFTASPALFGDLSFNIGDQFS